MLPPGQKARLRVADLVEQVEVNSKLAAMEARQGVSRAGGRHPPPFVVQVERGGDIDQDPRRMQCKRLRNSDRPRNHIGLHSLNRCRSRPRPSDPREKQGNHKPQHQTDGPDENFEQLSGLDVLNSQSMPVRRPLACQAPPQKQAAGQGFHSFPMLQDNFRKQTRLLLYLSPLSITICPRNRDGTDATPQDG